MTTKAKYNAKHGRVEVNGKNAVTQAPIFWEGEEVAQAKKSGNFKFKSQTVPDDCLGELSDGETTVTVPLAGCTVGDETVQIFITRAKYNAKRAQVDVVGKDATPNASIYWEGDEVARATKQGKFKFKSTVVPKNCVGSLDDSIDFIKVAIQDCIPSGEAGPVDLPDGEQCQEDNECESGACYPGLAGSKAYYCKAADRDCAFPSSPGEDLGKIIVEWDWQDYRCTDPGDGTRPHFMFLEGERCDSDLQCSSGTCSPGPDGEGNYCLHEELDCAFPKRQGFFYGAEMEWNNKWYQCQDPGDGTPAHFMSDFPGGNRPDGEACTTDSQCQSGDCYPGLVGQGHYCKAADRDCAFPSSPGEDLGKIIVEWDWQDYRCTDPGDGTRPHFMFLEGERCDSDLQCSSGTCSPGPDGEGNYCLHEELDCAFPKRQGFFYGAEMEWNNKWYQCQDPGDGTPAHFVSIKREADAFLTLEASVYPGKGTPQCDGAAASSAQQLLEALGKGVDEISGTDFVHQITGNEWLISRLSRIVGKANGPSVCGMACVKIPAGPFSWQVTAEDFSGESIINGPNDGREFGIGWSRLDQVSWTQEGDEQLVCAHVRNWKHDRERYIQLHVEY